MKKSAFTLAEITISLAIIGVVMAMVIPVVMTSVTDTSGLQYKKVFTDLQNAVDMVEEDTASYVPPLNYSQTTHFAGVAPENLCKMIANQFTTVGTVNCSSDSSNPDSTEPSFKQINGVDYWNVGGTGDTSFKNGETPCSATSYSRNCFRTIWIDINGKNKGKNTYGKDRFKLLLRYDGKVMLGTGDDWKIENDAIQDSTY